MVRTTELHSFHRRILRFTTPGRPGAAAACYVALWRLPRPDLHRLVISTFKAHQTAVGRPARFWCSSYYSDVTRSPWPVGFCQIIIFVLSLSGLRLCPLERASSAQDELHATISLMARELVDRRAARHHRHSDRPRLGAQLRVVNHELVLKRVGVNASESFDQAQLRSGALKARLPVALGRLHDQRVAFPVSARSARPLSEPAGKGRA